MHHYVGRHHNFWIPLLVTGFCTPFGASHCPTVGNALVVLHFFFFVHLKNISYVSGVPISPLINVGPGPLLAHYFGHLFSFLSPLSVTKLAALFEMWMQPSISHAAGTFVISTEVWRSLSRALLTLFMPYCTVVLSRLIFNLASIVISYYRCSHWESWPALAWLGTYKGAAHYFWLDRFLLSFSFMAMCFISYFPLLPVLQCLSNVFPFRPLKF